MTHFVERVVPPEQLHADTSDGWEVVESITFDGPVHIHNDDPRSAGGSYYPKVSQQVLGRIVAFRIRRLSDSPFAQYEARLAELDNALRKKHDELEVTTQELARSTEKYKELDLSFESATRHASGLEKVNADLRVAKLKLETDLGKIREHIGRKAFEEVLPPAPPPTSPSRP